MQAFFDALTSKRKNAKLPEEHNYFGKLIGCWKITYIDNNNSFTMNGEMAFLMDS